MGGFSGLGECVQDPKMDAVSSMVSRSVSLAGLAAHLPEIWPAAELEPEHQGAVGHSVHIFTLCREVRHETAQLLHYNDMFLCVYSKNSAVISFKTPRIFLF